MWEWGRGGHACDIFIFLPPFPGQIPANLVIGCERAKRASNHLAYDRNPSATIMYGVGGAEPPSERMFRRRYRRGAWTAFFFFFFFSTLSLAPPKRQATPKVYFSNPPKTGQKNDILFQNFFEFCRLRPLFCRICQSIKKNTTTSPTHPTRGKPHTHQL